MYKFGRKVQNLTSAPPPPKKNMLYNAYNGFFFFLLLQNEKLIVELAKAVEAYSEEEIMKWDEELRRLAAGMYLGYSDFIPHIAFITTKHRIPEWWKHLWRSLRKTLLHQGLSEWGWCIQSSFWEQPCMVQWTSARPWGFRCQQETPVRSWIPDTAVRVSFDQPLQPVLH
mgnify:CR=1 FL=1